MGGGGAEGVHTEAVATLPVSLLQVGHSLLHPEKSPMVPRGRKVCYCQQEELCHPSLKMRHPSGVSLALALSTSGYPLLLREFTRRLG